jgi:hypothetical protein
MNRSSVPPATTALAIAVLVLLPWGAADAEQVGLVSTRAAPVCDPRADSFQRLRYWELEEGTHWAPVDEQVFLGRGDPKIPTTIFIHGNRSDRNDAVRDGFAVLRVLASAGSDEPFRFVIWSWPADQVSKRPRPDLQVKAAYSDVQSYYLARCVSRMDPEVSISMIGYSYGARVITGAMELLAGGTIAGLRLDEPPEIRTGRMRAVLVAAAIDNDWLLPGRRNGEALDLLDKLLVTRNPCDPALKWYPCLYGRRGPNALGYTGPACPSALGPDLKKIELLDVAQSVGENHSWYHYLAAAALRVRLGWYGFLEETRSTQTAPFRVAKDN